VTVEEFLARLDGVKRRDDGWEARCPAHDDRHASLTVAEGTDGRVLVRCHAGDGCTFEEIVAAAGLKPADLFEARESPSRREVASYDYEDADGALLFQAVRFEPKGFAQRRPDGRGGWIWKLDKTRRVLYRLPRVLEAVKLGRTIYVVEGEKDVHAIEAAGEIATCNPMGAGKWRDTFSKILTGADVVVVRDRDEEGAKHAAKVVASLEGIARSVQVVEAAEGKDAADHLAAGRTLDELVQVKPDDPDTRTISTEPASLSGNAVRSVDRTPPGLAHEPDVFTVLEDDLRLAGLAGERRAARIMYLQLTSRVLPWGTPLNRPVSGIGKGSSSTGKSFTQQTVLRFFPPEAYFDLGSMSRRFLLYTEEELAHRFIIVPEWATIANDEEIVGALRILLSEGRLVHGTVDSGEGRRTARRIEKNGPTGLLMTTTRAGVDPELETRCLSFVTDDSPEQTRRVFEALAALEDEDDTRIDFARWHQLQRWLAEHGENRVKIPFVDALAALTPTSAPRLRRDFVSLVSLVRAHAVLHQLTRERDKRGRILATIEGDYAAVHALLDELVAEGVEASVSAATRETVEAVRELLDENEHAEHVSVRKISDRVGVGRSATYDRVKRGLAAGYLVNLAGEHERGLKIALGAELPAGGSFLPTPEELLVRAASGGAPGLANPLLERDRDELSGRPGCPVNPTRTPPELPANAPEWEINYWRRRTAEKTPSQTALDARPVGWLERDEG
jgi:hypothetical protein